MDRLFLEILHLEIMQLRHHLSTSESDVTVYKLKVFPLFSKTQAA